MQTYPGVFFDFFEYDFKSSKEKSLSSSRNKKQKLIHTSPETEETDTQQEIILKCKNMQNCSADSFP